MRRLPFLLLICAVTALGVAGCGGGDNGGSETSATTGTTATEGATGTTGASGGGTNVIKVSADANELAFTQKSLTAKAGKNKIEFTNPASISHDVKIEENGKDVGGTDVVTDGTAEATVQLDAGEPYTFYCSVPGHRQAGMEGKLTVK